MSDNSKMIERIAKNVGCTEEALSSKMSAILDAEGSNWLSAGKTEEQCELLALRVAGRQMKSQFDKVKRSGCISYEGMFVTVPRYKDWAEMAYKKMSNTLKGASEDLIHSLVEQGKIVYFQYDPVSNGYTKYSNPSLDNKLSFEAGMREAEVSSLPDKAVEIDSNSHFYLVWNATTPTFPSGDKNFKYGAARPHNERERTCLFFGRKQGDSEFDLFTFRFSGKQAEVDYPTYMPGTIAMRPAANGKVAYAKPQVTVFSADENLAEQFPMAPDALVKEISSEWLADGLQGIDKYYETHNGDSDWWEQWVATTVEVVHIDPRDNGGYVITVGDTDIMSMAPSLDIYVSAVEESKVDFSVGSELMIVGQPWKTRDDEYRLTINGWWCSDALQPSEVGGWD